MFLVLVASCSDLENFPSTPTSFTSLSNSFSSFQSLTTQTTSTETSVVASNTNTTSNSNVSSSTTSQTTTTATSSSSAGSTSSMPSSSPLSMFVITFNSLGGTPVNSISQLEGSTISEPQQPIRTGYTFSGWFTNLNFTSQFIFNSMPSQNLTLYAKWLAIEYTITFNSNGGTIVPPTVGLFGNLMSQPTNPTRTGYTFAGWFSDESLTTPFTFDKTFTQNLTVYAKWITNQYSIALNLYFMSKVDGGRNHSLALDNVGRVHAWGLNNYGQLGRSGVTSSLEPVGVSFHQITLNEWIVDISANEHSSFAITNKGRVFAWGYNQHSQLGDGTTNHRFQPTLITFADLFVGENIISLDQGEYHAIALSNLGRVFAWGNNFYGVVGNGTNINQSTPTLVNFNMLSNEETIIQITSGTYHNFALSNLGKVYGWGSNDSFELANGLEGNQNLPTLTTFAQLQPGETITRVESGGFHSLALTNQNRVHAWGANWYGQLGVGNNVVTPRPRVMLTTDFQEGEFIVDIALGQNHTLAVTNRERLFEWGLKKWTQIGDDVDVNLVIPTLVETPLQKGNSASDSPRKVFTGYYHSFVISKKGTLYTWQHNQNGELGLGHKEPTYAPTPYPFLNQPPAEYYNDGPILTIRAFDSALSLPNPVLTDYAFLGWNEDLQMRNPISFLSMPGNHFSLYGRWQAKQYQVFYELNGGVNHKDNPQTFTHESEQILLNIPTRTGFVFQGWYADANLSGEPVTEISSGTKVNQFLYAKWGLEGEVVSIGTSLQGSIIATSSNQLYVTGGLSWLNPASPLSLFEPFAWAGLSQGETISTVRMGNHHVVILTSLGRVLTLGQNTRGQLGNGTLVSQDTFVALDLDDLDLTETIVAIEVQGDTNFALTSMGRLFAWGKNNHGQLGHNEESDALTPQLVEFVNFLPGEKISEVRASANHVLAVTNEGRLFGWGWNQFMQLTSELDAIQRIPSLISIPDLDENETILFAEPGYDFSLVVTTEGRMFGWGSNITGELGFQSTDNHITPLPVFVPFLDLLPDERLVDLQASHYFTIGLTSLGRVFSWGANFLGQLGDGNQMFRRYTPYLVEFVELEETDEIISIYVGLSYTIAFTQSGRIYSWGLNDTGQLGQGTTTNSYAPVIVFAGHTSQPE